MEDISIKEAADTWSLTARRVHCHCTNSRIEGVRKASNVWLIPKTLLSLPMTDVKITSAIKAVKFMEREVLK